MKATHKITGRKLTVKKRFGSVALCYTGEKVQVFKSEFEPKCEVVACKLENLIICKNVNIAL